MRSLHLFAGAGGGLLADLILGHQPVGAVELDPYCCSVLRARRDDGWFPRLRVHERDIRLFDPSEYAGRVDIVHAGFPCVDVSVAGTGKGIDGARSGLVFEAIRVVDAVKPRFVLLENSPSIQTRGRNRIIAELVEKGYSWRDGILSAAAIGANHRRSRWWMLAANTDGLRELQQERREQAQRRWVDYGIKEEISDSLRKRLERVNEKRPEERATQRGISWWKTQPTLCGVADGFPDRVHQIKALGNAQVPLQSAVAFALLSGCQYVM